MSDASLNITQTEAAARARLVKPTSLAVELDVSDQTTQTFLSKTTLKFNVTEPGASTWVDLIAGKVMSVRVNGVEKDVADVVRGARIYLDDLEANMTVEVEANCNYMNTGEGLHRFKDPADDEIYLYSQFEVSDARRVFACFEQPDIKFPLALTVTAPANWQVFSNAIAATEVNGGRAVWRFAQTPSLPTYVMALVAGPYVGTTDAYLGAVGEIPLGVYARKSMSQFLDADEILEVTKQGFAWFESKFDYPYPFTKYDQVFVPEFNAGAMENAGCVTFRDDLIFRSRVTRAAYETRANTILHEMAHMWFGDLVTMQWWNDLWLNESFAEWAAHWASVGATKYDDAWTLFHIQRKAWAYRQDQLPSTHPIAAQMPDLDSVYQNFDGITYAKGASALRQLVAYVGEENFVAGARAYFKKHEWGNTTLPDLLSPLEEASGRDLSAWSKSWLETSGVTLLRPKFELNADVGYASFAIEQLPPSSPAGLAPVLRPHRLRVGLYDLRSSRLVLRKKIEVDVEGSQTSVQELVGESQPDLLLINDDDLTYAKVRLDERSLQTAVAHAHTIESSLTRALIWGAVWDMVRDAETSTGTYVELVCNSIGYEGDIGVVQTVLRQVRTAVDVYAAPENRAGYLKSLSQATGKLTKAAEPGSDRQLAFARAFASCAVDVADLEVLKDWLTGVDVLPGLVIDTDFRWALVMRLVVMGVFGEAEIESELKRDDTATGRENAAAARAALPDLSAKLKSWAVATEDETAPNAVVGAIVGSIAQADQPQFLEELATKYFEEIPRLWSHRTHEIGQTLLMGLYPALVVSPSTIDRARDALARFTDLPVGARRIIEEQADLTARALRCRAADVLLRG